MKHAAVILAAAAAGCATQHAIEQAVRPEQAILEVARRFDTFYPRAAGDPDPKRDAGLLSPRLGAPAIAQRDAAFKLDLLSRGGGEQLRAALIGAEVSAADAARCVAGGAIADCYPLTVSAETRTPLTREVANVAYAVRAETHPPAAGYDLYVETGVDAPLRAPRAVWLSDADPARPRPLRVVHLSDLHIGKGATGLEAHLAEVLADVERIAPDVVVITGDVVNRGDDATLPPRAAQLLAKVRAPLLIIPGNHDHGFGLQTLARGASGEGWPNFARSFHALLLFTVTIGGYDFVGFDSGPSDLSPRVLTRGIEATTLAVLGSALTDAQAHGRRGVVLFSHAPTRAVMSSHTDAADSGHFAQMRRGARELEAMMLAAAKTERVVHLTGHTHWSDLFVGRARADGALAFARWDGPLPEQMTSIGSNAAIVTVQSATHDGTFRDTSHGYGFVVLELGDAEPKLLFRHYDARAENH